MLVELPADCEASLAWVGDEHLVPPVALLGYVVDHPHRAAFLPFAEFSPEWQAFTWATQHDVAVRAIDLPLQQSLRRRRATTTASWRWSTPQLTSRRPHRRSARRAGRGRRRPRPGAVVGRRHRAPRRRRAGVRRGREAMTAVRGGATPATLARGAARGAHAPGVAPGDRRRARAHRRRVRRVARARAGRAAAAGDRRCADAARPAEGEGRR